MASHRSIGSASSTALHRGIIDLTGEGEATSDLDSSTCSDDSVGKVAKMVLPAPLSKPAVVKQPAAVASSHAQHVQPAKLRGFGELRKEQSVATRNLVFGGGPKPPKLCLGVDHNERWKQRHAMQLIRPSSTWVTVLN